MTQRVTPHRGPNQSHSPLHSSEARGQSGAGRTRLLAAMTAGQSRTQAAATGIQAFWSSRGHLT